MHRHADFASCTAAALDFAMASLGVENSDLRRNLLDAYLTLDAYPEVASVLDQLRLKRLRLAILSTGTPSMIESAVASAGLTGLFDACLSVEACVIYKPDPRVYRLVTDRLDVRPADVSFQSSNAWDVAGARAFGFRAVWISRTRQPDEYALRGSVPELISLADLPRLFGEWDAKGAMPS